MTRDFSWTVSSIAHLPAAACTISAPGSESPPGRGGGAEHRVGRVLSGFAVVGERLCAHSSWASGLPTAMRHSSPLFPGANAHTPLCCNHPGGPSCRRGGATRQRLAALHTCRGRPITVAGRRRKRALIVSAMEEVPAGARWGAGCGTHLPHSARMILSEPEVCDHKETTGTVTHAATVLRLSEPRQ
jgi:hypothetical protein